MADALGAPTIAHGPGGPQPDQGTLLNSILRRRGSAVLKGTAWTGGALIISLALCAPLLVAGGANVIDGYAELFDATFGSFFGFGLMLAASVPLILIGLGVAVPFRAGLFNIGGEGQLLMGALLAVYVTTTSWGGGWGGFVLPLLAGFFGGAMIGALPGALKAWRGVNEIVTTIMLSFIVLFFIQWLLTGSLRAEDQTYAASAAAAQGFRLERLAGGNVPVGFIIAVGVAILVYWLTQHTRVGWRQRLVGLNLELSTRQGIAVPRQYFFALVLGGGLAGLGGATELIGNQFRIGPNFSPGWGFTAVAIALLARGNMLAVVPVAMFFGLLQNGESSLQANLGIPGNLVLALAAAPVIMAAALLGYRNYRRAIMEPPDD